MMNNWNEYLSALAPDAPAASAPSGFAETMATASAAVTATAAPIASAGGSASAVDAVPGNYAHFGAALTAAQLADGFVAPVGNLGLIAATGPDAATFLHGQLTNDVANLPTGVVRLAGYCTPKGRLQATMAMWRSAAAAPDASGVVQPGAIYLQLPLALQAAFQKRLSMFVMRAKAKLVDATRDPAHAVVLGLGGARAEAALLQHVASVPPAVNTVVEHANGTVLRLADAFGAPRYLWLTSTDTALVALPALQQTLALGGSDAWELSGIHAGIAQVTSATLEQFVPQMINFELVGGVNFKKGCYPGQEIVARSQYLGKLKRRTALATIADPAAAAGAELFSLDDPAQPCGMIVNAAPNGAGGVDALVEVKLATLEQAVHLGSTAGARVEFLPMPYALDALDL
jgi:folate-binding protein YgfZ